MRQHYKKIRPFKDKILYYQKKYQLYNIKYYFVTADMKNCYDNIPLKTLLLLVKNELRSVNQIFYIDRKIIFEVIDKR